MMRRTCCPLVILVVLSILLNLSPALGALRPPEYAAVMNGVLCPADRGTETRLRDLWDRTLGIIDAPAQFKELKERFSWFVGNIYEQKLLLHWGWGGVPARHTPLMKQAEEDIRQYAIAQNIPIQDRETFHKAQQKDFAEHLSALAKRREGELVNVVAQELGIPRRRDYAKWTAAVIYNLHLLAEYTAVPSAPMPRLEEIERSLGESLKKLLTQGDNAKKRQRGDAIERELKEARRVNGNNKTKAQAMMRVVQAHLPVILNEGFEKDMRLKGIVLR